ncbi:hypothetical protein [uncultured Gilvimarinus sp.]|uniref:hypothetical protein n=1 Tax=uncultured Gilvimarinus sp. TaxID=1689143 RepID=UPI0030EEBC3B|tara:strand:+ start:247 stop:795 length:549 start_codon:yes stop_codon:yes gene_type:complete
MEHFVEIIKALAWPVAVIWMSFIFRAEVRALLSRVSTFKYKDVEASFGQSLEKAESEARNIKSPVKTNGSESESSQIEQLLRISEVSPRAAVVEAWTLIETAAMKNGLVMGGVIKRTNPKMILSRLEESGKFSPESINLLNELRQIRNKASHLPDFAVTQSDAERYLELAVKGAAVISAAKS